MIITPCLYVLVFLYHSNYVKYDQTRTHPTTLPWRIKGNTKRNSCKIDKLTYCVAPILELWDGTKIQQNDARPTRYKSKWFLYYDPKNKLGPQLITMKGGETGDQNIQGTLVYDDQLTNKWLLSDMKINPGCLTVWVVIPRNPRSTPDNPLMTAMMVRVKWENYLDFRGVGISDVPNPDTIFNFIEDIEELAKTEAWDQRWALTRKLLKSWPKVSFTIPIMNRPVNIDTFMYIVFKHRVYQPRNRKILKMSCQPMYNIVVSNRRSHVNYQQSLILHEMSKIFKMSVSTTQTKSATQRLSQP
jgi:hypothetical protein